jgi:carboxypeptidase PM20D1
MPEKETSIDILTRALVRLRENNFKAKFTQPMDDFVRFIGPEMPFIKKMIFANTWLFKGVLIGIYEKTGAGNAVVRTTLVPTIIDAGIKDNVVPRIATATINLRLLPGDRSSEITDQVKNIIDDKRINVKARYNFLSDPSRVTDAHGSGFQRVAVVAQRSYPDLLVTPLLMIGATDSRNFEDISANIIKFSPMVDPIGFHGIDERVSVESYKTSLWFYEQLIRGF